MLLLFIITIIIVYAFADADTLTNMAVSSQNLAHCFYYQFAHASWLHLLLNIVCLVITIRQIKNIWETKYNTTCPTNQILILSYFASVIAALTTTTPTVGCSGMVFALLGVIITINPTITQLKAFIYVALTLIIQIIVGKYNVLLHICAFLIGMSQAIVYLALKTKNHEP